MVFDCAKRADVMEEAIANGDHDLAKKIDDRVGFMTPILKVRALLPPLFHGQKRCKFVSFFKFAVAGLPH